MNTAFTDVYIFAARQLFMEMNFPHKSLTQTSADMDAKAADAHKALIAHAIARQALSPSARAYVARRNGMAGKPPYASRGLMEDRIKFFAGELPQRSSVAKSEKLFKKGHFRPDLSSKKSSGEPASE